MPRKKEEVWKTSVAKRLLYKDIVVGVVTDSMTASTVYNKRPEYTKWEFKKFQSKLRNLRKKIPNDYERMRSDCDIAMVKALRKQVNQPTIPCHKSEAKKSEERSR